MGESYSCLEDHKTTYLLTGFYMRATMALSGLNVLL